MMAPVFLGRKGLDSASKGRAGIRWLGSAERRLRWDEGFGSEGRPFTSSSEVKGNSRGVSRTFAAPESRTLRGGRAGPRLASLGGL